MPLVITNLGLTRSVSFRSANHYWNSRNIHRRAGLVQSPVLGSFCLSRGHWCGDMYFIVVWFRYLVVATNCSNSNASKVLVRSQCCGCIMKGLLPDVSDLELLGITEVEFIRRLIQRTIFATVCGLLSTILWISLWSRPPLIVLLFLCTGVPFLSWHIPVKQVATSSRIRRSDMDRAVAV